jgi:hypothetical protein
MFIFKAKSQTTPTLVGSTFLIYVFLSNFSSLKVLKKMSISAAIEAAAK